MLSVEQIQAQRAKAHEPVLVRVIERSINSSGDWQALDREYGEAWNWRPLVLHAVLWAVILAAILYVFDGRARAAETISSPYERAVAGKYYRQGLDQNCGTSHLEWLYPSQQADLIAAFEDTLAAEKRQRFEAAMKPDLDQCEAGADCLLNAYVIAANRLNLTADLGAYMCREAKMKCTAAQDCEAVDTP